jgi:ABC-2 type transport system permease protein
MTQPKYNQFTAMMAITRASFRSITRSPSAVVFTLLFPLIFILVFGFIGGNSVSLEVGLLSTSGSHPELIDEIRNLPGVQLITDEEDALLTSKLEKGRICATVSIRSFTDPSRTKYFFDIQTSAATPEKSEMFRTLMDHLVMRLNLKQLPDHQRNAEIRATEVSGRKYTMIDFILPGQLGFSILSTGVFGTAFVFFNLRQTLVIKRFFATPIRRPFILIGEALSRMVFTLLGSAFIIAIGYWAFGFTLIHGFQTALFMLLLSAIGLMVFMGFGFVISGLAQNESMIPPLANIITLPQFLLSGTFFPIEAFPDWLQPVCNILPLTYLNDALRQVAFEGVGLSGILLQLGIIGLWGIIVYALAVRFFRWE